jgi:hypothetical protein
LAIFATDINPVIGNQISPFIDQSQGKVGFARTRGAANQYALVRNPDTTGVQLEHHQ